MDQWITALLLLSRNSPYVLVNEDEQQQGPVRLPESSPPPNLPPNLVVTRGGGRFAAPPSLAPQQLGGAPLPPQQQSPQQPQQSPLGSALVAPVPNNSLVPCANSLLPVAPNSVAVTTANNAAALAVAQQPAAGPPAAAAAASNNILQTDLTALVISHLRTIGTPVYTKDMVKALGLKHKREVNPILYRLQDRGVLTKVWDTPPAWTLVPGSYGDLERNNLFAAAAAAAAASKQQASPRDAGAPPDFGGDDENMVAAGPNGVGGPRGGPKGPPKPARQPLPPHELLRLSNTFAQMMMQQQAAAAAAGMAAANGGVMPPQATPASVAAAAANLKITQSVVSQSLEVSYGQQQQQQQQLQQSSNGSDAGTNGPTREEAPVAAPTPAPPSNPPGPQSISKFPSYASLTKNPVSCVPRVWPDAARRGQNRHRGNGWPAPQPKVCGMSGIVPANCPNLPGRTCDFRADLLIAQA
ncbi:hypothetical protein HPB51_005645 [Rhipicephalus microplus]|uniref:Z-binding domain-containing protein n=1 Tax=Rhipicephalus microplus TaxID=6941 RepID=A0A9J6ELY5_RHIMP|nr:hypothetical protein HPB51_005645 [Rhipicephalus microplus]